MKKYQSVARDLIVVERAAWWNPRLRRIVKAAPLVVLFLLLNTRTARAACSFSPAPDPISDGASNSLRSAVQAANASGQDCLIELHSGTYTLTVPNSHGQENAAAEGDLDITDSGHTVTIQGKEANVSIVNGNGIDRVFQVLGHANATFRKLTIEGGIAQDNGGVGALPGATQSDGGGLLIQDDARVTLSQVWVEGNQAIGGKGVSGTNATSKRSGGPGAPGQAAAGGGLFLSAGSLALSDSKVEGNTASGGRGGIGGIGFGKTTFFGFCANVGNGGNGGAGVGGGLYLFSGSASQLRSEVSINRALGGTSGPPGYCPSARFTEFIGAQGNGGAAQGGGLFARVGTLDLRLTTVTENTAGGGAGTFSANSRPGSGGAAQGAGLFISSAKVSVTNATFFANKAFGGDPGAGAGGPSSATRGAAGSGAGGGLYLSRGSVVLAAATIASNKAAGSYCNTLNAICFGGGIANRGGGLFLNTTLIGNNFSGDPSSGNDVLGAVTSSHSLIGQTAGAAITDEGGNPFQLNPDLDTGGLKFNGGPTQTVTLESGSPAIDAVPLANCTDLASAPNPLIIDQRGFPRPDIGESNCNIGAYEVQDTAFVPFFHFAGNLRIDPDAGVFYLSSAFKLGSGGTIDPATFGVGDYAIRLPVGSFLKYSNGYVYQKKINGILVCLFLKFTSTPGTYQLLANRFGGILSTTTNPVPVTLTIGNDSGTTLMNAKFY